MRAIVLSGHGDPSVLRMEERPTPSPGPGEIRVRVRAFGLNRADLLQRIGRYPAPPGAPADIPGLEYAGEVDAVGSGAGLWAPGNRVMGVVAGGGYAEHVVVHEREAVRVPHGMDWADAAAVPEVFMTAFDALFTRLDLHMGEHLLVHAVGSGVGTAAVQLAHAAGAVVIGTSRTRAKLTDARELGLDVGIRVTGGGFSAPVLEATGDAGVNAILDLVGGPYFPENLEVLARRGRIVVVGTLGGHRAELDLGLLLRKRIQVTGTVLRARPLEEKIVLAREFSKRVLPLLTAGRVRPVVDRVFAADEVREAHERMEADANFGKIVLTWDD